jgi:hypothetical protein
MLYSCSCAHASALSQLQKQRSVEWVVAIGHKLIMYRYKGINGRQFQLIEHLIRKGHKQLAWMKHTDFTNFSYKRAR